MDDRRWSADLLDKLGIDCPVAQAPIGSLTTPELAAAVSKAGGLGTLALTWTSVGEARRRIRRLRALTSRQFGVNFVLCFPIDELLEATLNDGVPIVSTSWGDPGTVVERIHAAGAIHLHMVGSVSEAQAAVDCGVDVVVAQGWEAGGHVCGDVATLALVPAVVDSITGVPVIAAGGIADGRGLAAALALGAQGCWLGTRFAASQEAATHPHYRKALLAASADETVYSECFDGGWPHAPHRTLVNSTLEAWRHAGYPAAPERPGEGNVIAVDARGTTHRRYSSTPALREMEGRIEAMAMYAGQSAGLTNECRPAGELVREIVEEAERILGSSLTADR